MAAQKRKSVLVEPPAKRRKLDKTSKLVTSKERKLPDIKHVSNKSARLRKDMHKNSTKSRSSVNKSINRSSAPSSHSKQGQKHSKQSLNELRKKTLKTICKSLGKLSPIRSSPKSSKIRQANHQNSTKCSSKICYRGKGKPNGIKSKTSHEHKKQKKPSVDNKKCSGGVLHNRRSTVHIKATQKDRCSATKSMKENSKKGKTTKNGKRLGSNSIKIQKSKNSCPKKSAFQSPEPAPLETDEKACDPDQRKMTTRSEGAKSNKNPVAVRQEQLLLKKPKASQKEMVQDLPPIASDHERQTRRSLRLQHSSDVPTEPVCNRSRRKEVTSVTNGPQMKKPVNRIKNEKLKPVQQKTEEKPMKNDGRNKGKEVLAVEKTDPLKGKKQAAAVTPSNLTTPHNTNEESRNVNSHRESDREAVSNKSCSLASPNSVVAKDMESVHRNGRNGEKRVKAKRALPASMSAKPVDHPEDERKSKKISILELCEEIAGEIESDTVEVKRESPSTEYGKEEEKDTLAAVELPQTVVSAEEGTDRSSQCKRFFPSKKGVPVKCTVNGRHSTGNKNSKWTKIKLKKVNHVSQSISHSSSTLKPVFLKYSFPEQQQQQQVGAAEPHVPEAQKKSIQSQNSSSTAYGQKLNADSLEGMLAKEKTSHAEKPMENGLLEGKPSSELTPDENFDLHLESSPESTPMKIVATQPSTEQVKKDVVEAKSQDPAPRPLVRTLFPDKTSGTNVSSSCLSKISVTSKCGDLSSEEHIQKLKAAAKDSDKQLIIDAGQKRFGAISCSVCGMLYTAANPEDETQHLLFHNQFISAVKYVGWKKERILAEYPDGKIIMVLPDDPKYALKKVDEIREMVDNDLGFQQAPLTCSRTKTLLFIANDKKVTGCLIAEHIQWGYRVIEEKVPDVGTENEKVTFERQKAWCCSTSPEPAICGISRIWVFSLMRRNKIASRMLECLRSNFIYGSYLSKEEMAFSDPTPDGKLFATQYFGTSQFLVYNFVSGQQPT